MGAMSRLRRLETTGKIFFVTCNVATGIKQLSPSEQDIFLASLAEARDRLKFRLFAYVVMPSHWHALILPAPAQTISAVVHAIKRISALRLNSRRGMSGPFWQGRFYDTFMRKVRDFRETLEYIHTNPVRDGFRLHPASWRWSSYPGYATGRAPVSIDAIELPLDPSHRI